MGRVYYEMGLLSTHEVIECSASDLIGQYVGHTGPKTKEQLDRALGKVLFVDEADRLAEGSYALEAVNELVYLLTTPRYDGKMVVILAGYTQEMEKLMTVRPALSGIFPDEIIFHNLTPSDCVTLLDRELELKRTSAPFLKDTSSTTYPQLLRFLKALSLLPSWSNARDIKTLAKKMSMSATRGKTPTGEPQRTLSAEQALECTKNMMVTRYGRSSKQEGSGVKYPVTLPKTGEAASQQLELNFPSTVHHEPLACDTYAESSTASAHGTRQNAQNVPCVLPTTIAPPSLAPSRQPRDDAGATRDAGVSDAIWDQLQVDKQNKESCQKLKREDARRRDEAIQQKLQQMGLCPAGYDWIEQSGGYRCSGGSHYISNSQLGES